MGLLDKLTGKHSAAAPLLAIYKRELTSFYDLFKEYPTRPASIPGPHQPPITEVETRLRSLRTQLDALASKMTIREGKKYGDLLRRHEALSMEYFRRR